LTIIVVIRVNPVDIGGLGGGMEGEQRKQKESPSEKMIGK
jgi:hypothetical protein